MEHAFNTLLCFFSLNISTVTDAHALCLFSVFVNAFCRHFLFLTPTPDVQVAAEAQTLARVLLLVLLRSVLQPHDWFSTVLFSVKTL